VQKEVVLGSKRSIVTVEEVVDDFGARSANTVILPAWTVGAIVQVPGGAYPSYTFGYYKRDNAYYKAWEAISKDRDTFLAWMKANVLEQGPEVYAAHARKLPAAAE
jgi:glutaconate CoA-transferase subunit A